METNSASPVRVLGSGDPAPFAIHNPAGGAPFVLVGDHAGNRVPRALDGLGLPAAELARHIGWDIGVAALGTCLADRLDAVFVEQIYSRLVIDCNRTSASAEAILAVSDGTTVPGNQALTADMAAARIAAIHAPYHAAIAAEIARRSAAGQPTILIALHSFTPRLGPGRRPWQVGVLHDRGNTGFARAVLAALRGTFGADAGDNQPYRMDDTDFTVPAHAYDAGLAYAELEIRQDGLGDAAGVERWCEILYQALTTACG